MTGLLTEPTAAQLSTPLQFTYAPQPDIDLALLDDWLTGPMQIAPQPVAAARAVQEQAAPQSLGVVWRAALLAQALLQACRLPVFDPPEILSMEPEGEHPDWLRVSVRFPVVEMIRLACYETALSNAVRLLHWAGTRPVTDAARKHFFDAIDREVIVALLPMVPGGKATVPSLRVAHAMGIPFLHLGVGVYQLGWGSKARLLDRSVTGGDSAIGARVSQNKVDTARVLAIAGLPAPTHRVVTSLAQAKRAARALGWPLVVKPADRDRGLGVTVDVSSEALLEPAFKAANDLTRAGQVIVERQAPGVCHRLFIAHGRLLYGVKRLPMAVLADGRRTVAQLVADDVTQDLRLPSWKRSGIQPLDEMARVAISAAGWTEHAVPPEGTWVPLRRIENTEWGGIDEDVTGIIHPDNLDVAVRAATLLGLEVAGIDIITEDIRKSWRDTDAIINEVNYSPLLGGGDISRSHIPEFMRRLLGDDGGRIPVTVFAGGDQARAEAEALLAQLHAQGLRAWLSTGTRTVDGSGREMYMRFHSVRERARALVMNAQVDAIVLLMSARELQTRGLPLAGVTDVRQVAED